MTIAQEASAIRKRYKAERLNLSQVAEWLGVDRKTAQRLVQHLDVLDMDGIKRWRVTDIAEYININTRRGTKNG